jgi:hypothetical protein
VMNNGREAVPVVPNLDVAGRVEDVHRRVAGE